MHEVPFWRRDGDLERGEHERPARPLEPERAPEPWFGGMPPLSLSGSELPELTPQPDAPAPVEPEPSETASTASWFGGVSPAPPFSFSGPASAVPDPEPVEAEPVEAPLVEAAPVEVEAEAWQPPFTPVSLPAPGAPEAPGPVQVMVLPTRARQSSSMVLTCALPLM